MGGGECGGRVAGQAKERQSGQHDAQQESQPPGAVAEQDGQRQAPGLSDQVVEFLQESLESLPEAVRVGHRERRRSESGGRLGQCARECGVGTEEELGLVKVVEQKVTGFGQASLERFIGLLSGGQLLIAAAIRLQLGALDLEGFPSGGGFQTGQGSLSLIFQGQQDSALAVVVRSFEEEASFAGVSFATGAGGLVLFAGHAEGFLAVVAHAVGACSQVAVQLFGLPGHGLDSGAELVQQGEDLGGAGERTIHSRDGFVGGHVRGRRGQRWFG